MYQESGLLGAYFGTVYFRITGASEGFAPGSNGRLIVPHRQPASPGDEIRSLHIVLSAGCHFYPCPHDKFGPRL